MATCRITYVGHATLLIEIGSARLLTDPVLRSRMAHLRRHARAPAPLGDVDAVLVSHLHGDHLDLPSLRLLEGRPRVIAPRGAGPFLRRAGVEVHELEAGESTDIAAVEIRAVHALHDPRRRPWLGPTAEPVGFMIGARPSVYFAGDTDVFDAMAELGPVDVALLPVAGWGPRLGPGHMNPERAARATALLRPHVAIPIHWGTFHPAYARRGAWFSDPPLEFAAQVAAVAPSVDVRVLMPGESTSVSA
ncbi:MAG TPA: MBL fold metallo-hydrolase [Thermoleophilaceae bacterium]|nr:MBL fold metallo-hydrolase [Thermoleophilaceae bacterium]